MLFVGRLENKLEPLVMFELLNKLVFENKEEPFVILLESKLSNKDFFLERSPNNPPLGALPNNPPVVLPSSFKLISLLSFISIVSGLVSVSVYYNFILSK